MLIIADYRYPEAIHKKLAQMGDLLLFDAGGLVYESISGHPDIFLCETPAGLVVAPNTPATVIKALEHHQINYHTGDAPVGKKHPGTIPYNALVTPTNIIHHQKFTDKRIHEKNAGLEPINIKQGYTRCSLFSISDNTFITSDRGIEKALKDQFDLHYFSPEKIWLTGQRHGFLGGCVGKSDQTIFFTGKVDTLPYYDMLQNLLSEKNLEYTELYDGPLVDGGGLFFLKT